jgi:hypothetical protein
VAEPRCARTRICAVLYVISSNCHDGCVAPLGNLRSSRAITVRIAVHAEACGVLVAEPHMARVRLVAAVDGAFTALIAAYNLGCQCAVAPLPYQRSRRNYKRGILRYHHPAFVFLAVISLLVTALPAIVTFNGSNSVNVQAAPFGHRLVRRERFQGRFPVIAIPDHPYRPGGVVKFVGNGARLA